MGVNIDTINVGMLWHSPNSANLGVGALTIGNMELVQRAAAKAGFTPRFDLIGFADPGKPHYVEGPDVAVTLLNAKAMLPGGALGKSLARCDIVLDIGGGDSFTDIYGTKRLVYMMASKFAVLARRIPLVLSPQTIGPFTGAVSRRAAGLAMKNAAATFARDPKSFDAARDLSPTAKLAQTVDVAFAMPFEALDHGPGTHVGINVSGLLFNGGYTGRNEFGMDVDYPVFTRRLIEALLERDCIVHLVPHVLSDAVPQDDDRTAIAKLVEEYPSSRSAPEFDSPVAAKSFIAGLDLLVGGRMHACIAAYSTGGAVVPVAYSRKFSGLFEGTLDYPYLIPVKGMSTDQALAYTLDCLGKREELAAAAKASQTKTADLLQVYTDALAELFSRAMNGHGAKR